MRNRVERQSEARMLASKRCKILGLNPHTSILPKYEERVIRVFPFKKRKMKSIVGYYIIDATGSTAAATIEL